ncbi:hypothetical protein SUGI_0260090 [Cryptomeria japonica]|nr:hypothetical protein SUGI_0260090 [Cryptomeria japonica]
MLRIPKAALFPFMTSHVVMPCLIRTANTAKVLGHNSIQRFKVDQISLLALDSSILGKPPLQDPFNQDPFTVYPIRFLTDPKRIRPIGQCQQSFPD